jgi:hypothetical protein
VQDGGEEGTKVVDDMTGSMLLDRREPGTRKRVDASLTATSFVPALLVDGHAPLVFCTWCGSGHSFAESHNDVGTSISALLTLNRVVLGMGFCYRFVAS